MSNLPETSRDIVDSSVSRALRVRVFYTLGDEAFLLLAALTPR